MKVLGSLGTHKRHQVNSNRQQTFRPLCHDVLWLAGSAVIIVSLPAISGSPGRLISSVPEPARRLFRSFSQALHCALSLISNNTNLLEQSPSWLGREASCTNFHREKPCSPSPYAMFWVLICTYKHIFIPYCRFSFCRTWYASWEYHVTSCRHIRYLFTIFLHFAWTVV